MQETLVWFLGQEDPLEKGKAAHSSILAWRVPWGPQNLDMTEQISLSLKTWRGQKGDGPPSPALTLNALSSSSLWETLAASGPWVCLPRCCPAFSPPLHLRPSHQLLTGLPNSWFYPKEPFCSLSSLTSFPPSRASTVPRCSLYRVHLAPESLIPQSRRNLLSCRDLPSHWLL